MKKILLLLISATFLVGSSFAQKWVSLGSNIHGHVSTMTEYKGDLIIAGSFSKIGEKVFNNIASWDGEDWWALGDGINKPQIGEGFAMIDVFSLAVYKDELYACGNFQTPNANDISNNGIAKWNGKEWLSVSKGLPHGAEANALIVYKDELYMAGDFSKINGVVLSRCIAKWDGDKWLMVAPEEMDAREINTMCMFNDELYIGGDFDFEIKDDKRAFSVAKWNGKKWFPTGDKKFSTAYGKPGDIYLDHYGVRALTSYNNEVYAGGHFSKVDGNRANAIVKWKNSNWTPIGTGVGTYKNERSTDLNGYVSALMVFKDELYIGGRFESAGGLSTNNITKWDGENFHAFGGQINDEIYSFCIYKGELYAAGDEIYIYRHY